MKNIFSSLYSRFQLACSLAYASGQLLRIFALLLIPAFLSDWQRPTHSQSHQQQANTPDPEDWYPDDLSDEEITEIWLSMLDDPDIHTSCCHHLTRCANLPDACKTSNNS